MIGQEDSTGPKSFGSQEVQLVGERLNYELLEGSGPYSGDSARNSAQCRRLGRGDRTDRMRMHEIGHDRTEEWEGQHTVNEQGT